MAKANTAVFNAARNWLTAQNVAMTGFVNNNVVSKNGVPHTIIFVRQNHADFNMAAVKKAIAKSLGLANKWDTYSDHNGQYATLDFGPKQQRRVAVSLDFTGEAEIIVKDFSLEK